MKFEDGQEEQIASKLRNGHAADLQTQGHALAEIIDKMNMLHEKIAMLPNRSEVREMMNNAIANHVLSCSAGRQNNDNSLFELGKTGLKAVGKNGILVTAVVSVCLVYIITKISPYIMDWIQAYMK